MLTVDVVARVGSFELSVQLSAEVGTTVVVGPNGAGKSTLLACLLGAVAPERGEIRLDDEALFSEGEGVDVPIEDRKLGYLPQRYALFPHLSVAGNVGFGIRGCSRQERDDRARSLLAELEVAHLASRAPASLSGGEAQRVALARALAIGPRALLLDEPMAALDAGARRAVRQFLADRLRTIAVPSLVVSHDVADVEALGGRVVVLEQGRVVQTGTLDELRAAPATPFVQHFLDDEPEPAQPQLRAIS